MFFEYFEVYKILFLQCGCATVMFFQYFELYKTLFFVVTVCFLAANVRQKPVVDDSKNYFSRDSTFH